MFVSRPTALLAALTAFVVALPPGQFVHYPLLMDENTFRVPSEYAKRRPTALRNCFLSPVQCLLPVDDRRFSKFHKRFIYSF
ncbi:hypothetical protein KIN20_018485 [Parelaphostrongylus tenuis]|uniref:Secreted protein n=1 Tax=Parelaphostrongylus tenuis TaxID=148309 RepID=A0AAD5QPM2_PARTN|nr:hypothetical protein KIN20_018456 [Parelaphostrongylus tenuis]KAJ1359683.1 hypothetical protein KIN20_018467 [Parelaphostrongylus tenuis]KAJ1359686.1 hypothetical protein KIN20_018470 [Parelaphostrongylus tenuis]KAJ1359701.1 hypothetical protein KIN20_018485 [Parelaphostrongylus tenuis]